VNWSAGLVVDVPADDATVTSTVPEPAGLVTVIWLSEPTSTIVPGAVPKATPVAEANPLPVTVTASPPAAEPEVGDKPDTTGGAT
jgi:hypothetical protein